jgi:hypothetical protein
VAPASGPHGEEAEVRTLHLPASAHKAGRMNLPALLIQMEVPRPPSARIGVKLSNIVVKFLDQIYSIFSSIISTFEMHQSSDFCIVSIT